MTPEDLNRLEELAKAATLGPWKCKEGKTTYPECDDADFWSVVLSPAGKEIVTLRERHHARADDRGDYDFDAAFIAAANPAAILELIALARQTVEAGAQAHSRIGTNSGHGHVWPRPDGVKARCGGPGICKECARDADMISTAPTTQHKEPDNG